ncbi:hypothetical protein HHUSO_G17880, partial [Huso huso]
MAAETCPNQASTKRFLVYKLLVLQTIRNSLEQELGTFTQKLSTEVHTLLKATEADFLRGCLGVLGRLDQGCSIVQQVCGFFQEIKAGKKRTVKPSCLLAANPKAPLLAESSPALRGVLVSDILKFGPVLSNVLMASSITNAVQTLGAALAFQQIQTFLNPQREVVSRSTSTCYSLEIQVYHSLPSFQTKDMQFAERSAKPKQQHQLNSLKENVRDPLGQTADKDMIVQQVSASLLNRSCGKGLEVQHQKLTSSQLLSFLKNFCKTDSSVANIMHSKVKADSVCRPAFVVKELTETPQVLRAFEGSPGAGFPSKTGLKQKNIPCWKSLLPVFKVKRQDADDSETYSCMVATESELWDISEISVKGSVVMEKAQCNLEKDNRPRALSCLLGVAMEPGIGSCSQDGRGVIPDFQIRKFDEVEVAVTHVVDPSCFFIQDVGPPMQELAMELNSRTCSSSSPLTRVNSIPDIGSYVCGWFPKHELWCRAQVEQICGMQREANPDRSRGCLQYVQVHVLRVDYGDTACLPLSDIKELSPQFMDVPQQALCVSLEHVSPVDGSEWSSEAISWFQDKVEGRSLYARLYPKRTTVMVELFMEKGKLGEMRRGPSLSERLAQNGHAKHARMRTIRSLKSGGKGQKEKLFRVGEIHCFLLLAEQKM